MINVFFKSTQPYNKGTKSLLPVDASQLTPSPGRSGNPEYRAEETQLVDAYGLVTLFPGPAAACVTHRCTRLCTHARTHTLPAHPHSQPPTEQSLSIWPPKSLKASLTTLLPSESISTSPHVQLHRSHQPTHCIPIFLEMLEYWVIFSPALPDTLPSSGLCAEISHLRPQPLCLLPTPTHSHPKFPVSTSVWAKWFLFTTPLLTSSLQLSESCCMCIFI